MDMAGTKEVVRNPPMLKTDKMPNKVPLMNMNDNERFTEITSPKPKIVRAPRITRKRIVTFTETAPMVKLPNENIEVEEEEENDATNPNVVLGSKDEITKYQLNNEVTKLNKLVANGMRRLKQERINHEKVVECMVEKGKNYEAEIEDLTIKVKIARESELENKVKYINMKTKFSKANSQVTVLTESSTIYEREYRLLEAKLSGLEAREQVGKSPTANESQLRDKIKLLETLHLNSQKELETCRGRIEILEVEKDGDQRIIKKS
jgi:hypothetical protein